MKKQPLTKVLQNSMNKLKSGCSWELHKVHSKTDALKIDSKTELLAYKLLPQKINQHFFENSYM